MPRVHRRPGLRRRSSAASSTRRRTRRARRTASRGSSSSCATRRCAAGSASSCSGPGRRTGASTRRRGSPPSCSPTSNAGATGHDQRGAGARRRRRRHDRVPARRPCRRRSIPAIQNLLLAAGARRARLRAHDDRDRVRRRAARGASGCPEPWSRSRSSRSASPPGRSARPGASRSPPTPTATATAPPGRPTPLSRTAYAGSADGGVGSVALVGVDDVAQGLAGGVAAQVVDEEVDGAVEARGATPTRCARSAAPSGARRASGPAGSGSGSTVSSVAIATRSSSSATRSASWSTSRPRAMFTRCTPGFTSRERVGVEQVLGARRERHREHEVVRRARAASSSDGTSSTPSTGLGASVRRSASTRIPNGSARSATATPIPPRPTMPERPALRARRAWSKFQCSGGSCEPDLREPLLEREHRAEHELGDRHRARAAGARDDPPVEQLAAAPCRRRCRSAAPTGTRWAYSKLCGPQPPNSTSAVRSGRRRVGPEVDDLGVGHRGADLVADPRARAR